MSAWWNTLSLASQVFYGVAFLASGVLVLQLILGFFGADDSSGDALSAHDASFADGSHHPSGLAVFSIRTVSAFLAGFGWTGAIWLSRGHGVLVAGLCGTLVGAALMVSTFLLMRSLLRLQDSGTLDYANAVGLTGTVYAPVPPGRGAGGQVEVLIQGRVVFADAVSDASEVLRTGSKVRVVSLVGRSSFVVEAA
jgi:hypothetical protein